MNLKRLYEHTDKITTMNTPKNNENPAASDLSASAGSLAFFKEGWRRAMVKRQDFRDFETVFEWTECYNRYEYLRELEIRISLENDKDGHA